MTLKIPGLGFISEYTRQPDELTCQSASCAQMLGLSTEADVRKVREELLAIAKKRGTLAGDPRVMQAFLEPRVTEYKLNLNASLEDARKALDEGYKLITHGYFTGSGHVISIVGWEPSVSNLNRRFIVDDPWCEFDFPNWRYQHNKTGNNVRYSFHGMYAACVVGQSKSDARRIYNQGRLNSNDTGMWLHCIKNEEDSVR
jgi:hypothetical protein